MSYHYIATQQVASKRIANALLKHRAWKRVDATFAQLDFIVALLHYPH